MRRGLSDGHREEQGVPARETFLIQGYPNHKRLCLHFGVLGETCKVHAVLLVLARHVIWRGHHNFRHVLILLLLV